MKSIVSLFLVIFMTATAQADTVANEGFCQNAQTTADLVACSGRHLEARNTHLKDLYDAVVALYKDDPVMFKIIQDRQAQWIQFRDDTCKDEAAAFAGGSLERVQETMCKARMTRNWAGHLRAFQVAGDETQLPVFAAPPRWVNVLINDYPDVYWNFATPQKADIDCDTIEEVMANGYERDADGTFHTIHVIADSDKTGRPMVSVLNFDDKQDCVLESEFIITPNDKATEESAMQCQQMVNLQTKNCGAFTLHLDEETKSYTLSPLNEKDKE